MPWQADASLDQLVDGAVPNAESSTGGARPQRHNWLAAMSVTPADSGWLDRMQAFD